MFKIETNANGGWIIPDWTEIDAGFEIPAYSEIGDDCTLGPSTAVGQDSTWLGVKVESWLTLANVDGAGMHVTMVKHAEGVMVNAGCFLGTLEEFVERVADQGMNRYVAVVSAVAAAM